MSGTTRAPQHIRDRGRTARSLNPRTASYRGCKLASRGAPGPGSCARSDDALCRRSGRCDALLSHNRLYQERYVMVVTNDSLRALNAAQTVSETDPFTERRYAQFASLLVGCRAALDVGCNTGRGGSVLRSRLPSLETLHGVDLVPERLASLPPAIYDETFAARVEELPASSSYDAIVAGEVIEHVPYESLYTFLVALRNMLRPNGLLLLTTPNPHYVLLKRRAGGSVFGGSHLSAHCPVALAQYLRYLGFGVDAVMGTGRISTLIGTRFPLPLYGSYLVKARRPVAAG